MQKILTGGMIGFVALNAYRMAEPAQEAIHLDEQEYDRAELASQLEAEMVAAAEALDFERAAVLRDQLKEIKALPELKDSSAG